MMVAVIFMKGVSWRRISEESAVFKNRLIYIVYLRFTLVNLDAKLFNSGINSSVCIDNNSVSYKIFTILLCL